MRKNRLALGSTVKWCVAATDPKDSPIAGSPKCPRTPGCVNQVTRVVVGPRHQPGSVGAWRSSLSRECEYGLVLTARQEVHGLTPPGSRPSFHS
jgi:hypothetical protein